MTEYPELKPEDEETDGTLQPLKVEITNQPKEKPKENPTSYDTKDEYDFDLTEELIKEMTDAQ